jgi:hypothetical protein
MSTGQRTILQRLEAAATGPKLYHATRILLEVGVGVRAGDPEAPSWRSGVDPADGWQEFLGAMEIFEAREYQRLGRWQQSCYYGSRERMNEYTLLASEAWNLLPVVLASPLAAARILHMDRDVWMFALYFLAMGSTLRYGFDVFGAAPYEFAVEAAERVKWVFARTAGGLMRTSAGWRVSATSTSAHLGPCRGSCTLPCDWTCFPHRCWRSATWLRTRARGIRPRTL